MFRSKNGPAALVAMLGISLGATAAHATGEVWDVVADPTNGFNGLTTGWSLSDPDSAYAAWNFFNSYPSDNTPDVASFGLGTASVTENSLGGFVTGGGNIYSFAVATDFTSVLDGAATDVGGNRTVAIRIETLGTALDLASVSLTIAGTTYTPTLSSLVFTASLGGFGGTEEERVFLWENVPSGIYSFDFTAAGSSMSLARFESYVGPAAIPEPGTLLLVGAGLVGLATTGRRRTA